MRLSPSLSLSLVFLRSVLSSLYSAYIPHPSTVYLWSLSLFPVPYSHFSLLALCLVKPCFNSTPVHSSPAPSHWLCWREPPQPQWQVSFYIHDSRPQWVRGIGSPSVSSRSTPSSTSLDPYFTCSLLSLHLQDLLDFLTSILLEGKKNRDSQKRTSLFSQLLLLPLYLLSAWFPGWLSWVPMWSQTLHRVLDCIPSQFSSVAQSCPTLCNPMNRSTPGLPVHHQLLEFTQTHVPSSRWCHPATSSSVVPFSSCPQSLPASESFPMSQLFA